MSANNYLIVVGVDGSEGGRRALGWAATEAARHGGTVQAVIAWSWDGVDFVPAIAQNPSEAQERANRILNAEITALAAKHGTRLPVAAEVIEGRAADVLVAAGRSADLLVLGSHGHSRVRHTVLGSVSEDCIRKAPCPVVVIPVPVAHVERENEPVLRGCSQVRS